MQYTKAGREDYLFHKILNYQFLKQLLINANSHKSIKQFTRSIGVQTLKCNKAHALVNTNTPAQFKAVNEQFDQHKPNLLRRTL